MESLRRRSSLCGNCDDVDAEEEGLGVAEFEREAVRLVDLDFLLGDSLREGLVGVK